MDSALTTGCFPTEELIQTLQHPNKIPNNRPRNVGIKGDFPNGLGLFKVRVAYLRCWGRKAVTRPPHARARAQASERRQTRIRPAHRGNLRGYSLF